MNFDRFRLKIPGLSAWKFGVRHQMSLNSADQEDAESVGWPIQNVSQQGHVSIAEYLIR